MFATVMDRGDVAPAAMPHRVEFETDAAVIGHDVAVTLPLVDTGYRSRLTRLQVFHAIRGRQSQNWMIEIRPVLL